MHSSLAIYLRLGLCSIIIYIKVEPLSAGEMRRRALVPGAVGKQVRGRLLQHRCADAFDLGEVFPA